MPDDPELSDALRELRELYGADISYSCLWTLIVAGRVPAHRVGRRWHMQRSDYPRIAAIIKGSLLAA